jgi:hypothetical protein
MGLARFWAIFSRKHQVTLLVIERKPFISRRKKKVKNVFDVFS